MKRYLALMGLVAVSMNMLHASSSVPEKKETPNKSFDGYASCGVLNPYQNDENFSNFLFGAGYVGGVFAPQNIVVATDGVYDARTAEPTEGQFVEAKMRWTNGISMTLGVTGAGPEAASLVSESFFVVKSNGASTTLLDSSAASMKTSYPSDLLWVTGNNYDATLGSVYRAAGQYTNHGYYFTTLMVARPVSRARCSLLLSEIGLSSSLLAHKFNVSYSEYSTITALGEIKHQYTTNENVFSVGPHVRFRVRQMFGNCFTVEGMLGAAGHLQRNAVAVDETYSAPINETETSSTSRVNVGKVMSRYTHLVEGRIGINYHICYDATGFCNGAPKKTEAGVKNLTSVEFGLSWNFQARPAFTMVTDVPYGVTAGTMQPWSAQYLVANISVKM